jgi:hypothetical protein
MTGLSTSARQAAVDAAIKVYAAHWSLRANRDNPKPEAGMDEAVTAALKVLVGDLRRSPDGKTIVDRFGNTHLHYGDASPALWALLEAILPTRDERQA